MAKAREQAAAEKPEEAQTNVSRQGETRRLTDKVGQLSNYPKNYRNIRRIRDEWPGHALSDLCAGHLVRGIPCAGARSTVLQYVGQTRVACISICAQISARSARARYHGSGGTRT